VLNFVVFLFLFFSFLFFSVGWWCLVYGERFCFSFRNDKVFTGFVPDGSAVGWVLDLIGFYSYKGGDR